MFIDFAAFPNPSETSNPVWRVDEFTFYYQLEAQDEDIGAYRSVVFRIELSRRSGFFVANVILPSILINYLSLATFIIPPEEKTGFSVSILLAQTVNLMSTSQFIPNGGIELPIWGKYLSSSIIFLTLIILINILLNFLRDERTKETCLQFCRLKKVPNACGLPTMCLTNRSQKVNGEPVMTAKTEDEKGNENYRSKDEAIVTQVVKVCAKINTLFFVLGLLTLTGLTVATLVRLTS